MIAYLNKRILLFLLPFLCCWLNGKLYAQELLITVSIDAGAVPNDPTTFEDMKKNISNYFNLTKWTDDKFAPEERIRGNLRIVVTARPSTDQFEATATFQIIRPVYGTTYETVLVTFNDPNFNFNYVPFQTLNYIENTFNDRLTGLLNYYAFLILGFDYDSFSLNGGKPYFEMAQEIVNLANGAGGEAGWTANSNRRNTSRYWIIEGLMNSSYRGFHTLVYKYHRRGLDMMAENPVEGRRAILDALRELQALNKTNQLLPLIRIFLDTKEQEIIAAFTNAFVNDKKTFLEIMQEIDPSNLAKYEAVNESK